MSPVITAVAMELAEIWVDKKTCQEEIGSLVIAVFLAHGRESYFEVMMKRT